MKRVPFVSATLLLVPLVLITLGCGGGGEKPKAGAPSPPKPTGPPKLPLGDPIVGQQRYLGTCSACHGPTAEGLPKLGKNLVTSEWAKGQTDAQLLAFLKVGRPALDPLNTTKVDMPPKGGNPSLTDKDLIDIIAYVRRLQQG